MAPNNRHTDPLQESAYQQRSRALTLRRRQMQRRAQLMMSGLLVAFILLAAGGLGECKGNRQYYSHEGK